MAMTQRVDSLLGLPTPYLPGRAWTAELHVDAGTSEASAVHLTPPGTHALIGILGIQDTDCKWIIIIWCAWVC